MNVCFRKRVSSPKNAKNQKPKKKKKKKKKKNQKKKKNFVFFWVSVLSFLRTGHPFFSSLRNGEKQ